MKVWLAVIIMVVVGSSGLAQEKMTPEQEAAARKMLSGGNTRGLLKVPTEVQAKPGVPVAPAVVEIPPAAVEKVPPAVEKKVSPAVVEVVPVEKPVVSPEEALDATQVERLLQDERRRNDIRRLEAEMQSVVDARAEKARKRAARLERKRLGKQEAAGARAVMDELNLIEEERYQPRTGTETPKKATELKVPPLREPQ